MNKDIRKKRGKGKKLRELLRKMIRKEWYKEKKGVGKWKRKR